MLGVVGKSKLFLQKSPGQSAWGYFRMLHEAEMLHHANRHEYTKDFLRQQWANSKTTNFGLWYSSITFSIRTGLAEVGTDSLVVSLGV